MLPRRLTGLLFALVLVAADAQESAPNPSLTADERTILDLTNKARADNKLPPLSLNAVLTKAARAHSADMAKEGKMAHVLNGKTPVDRLKAAGYKYSYSGENVAFGENVPVREIFDGWMKSKPHRENILREQYTEVGVGTARNDKGEVYYTQDFGTPRSR
jgi:uncharacterized protein YkwD